MNVQFKTRKKNFAVELNNRLKFNIRKYLQSRRLLWFGHLERMERRSSPSKCRKLDSGGGLARGRTTKIWSEVIRDVEAQKANASVS